MQLLLLEECRHKVLAVMSGDPTTPECPVLDFFAELPADMQRSAAGVRVLFGRFASQGRQGLTAEQFHLANREEGIWEFLKGRLRIYAFMDGGTLVVLTHGNIKKTQKAPRADVKRAVKFKLRYLEDKASDRISIIREADR